MLIIINSTPFSVVFVFVIIIIIVISVTQRLLLNKLRIRIILAEKVALRVVTSCVLQFLLPLSDILLQELFDRLRLRLLAALNIGHVLICFFDGLSCHLQSLLLLLKTLIAKDGEVELQA